MKERALENSRLFWKALERSDTAAMRAICHPDCYFVHIGGNADLDKEMEGFEKKIFQPTEIVLHKQEAHEFGDVVVVICDVDYGLLLDGKPTTHHFATTEVYKRQDDAMKLIQFTFTALVY